MAGRAPAGVENREGLRIAVLAAADSLGSASVAVEVARRLADSAQVAGVEVRALPAASRASSDPFRLRDWIPDSGAEVVVVVAPRRWGSHRLIPAPAVGGRTVALVQADRRADLPVPGEGIDPAAPWVVAAMAKNVFLGPAGQWVATLAGEGRHVVDLRADRARRDDLVAALEAGPAVVLYAGHGRTRGWGGYQALRWAHLEPVMGRNTRAAGLVIAFACDTLKRARSGVPFGSRMVAGSVARAYLGAAGPILTADAEELAAIAVSTLARGPHPTVAELVASIDRAVEGRPAATRAWRQFRLLGDPTVSVFTN